MNTFKQLRQLAKPALLALPALVITGAAHGAPTWAADPVTNWKVAQVTPASIRISNKVETGTLHAVCMAKGCELFVEPIAGCIPGSTYPVLVNSATKVSVVPARCALIRGGDKPSLVAHLTKSEKFLPSIIRGEDISIAFPTQGGAMNVLNIRMAGATELLANAMRMSGMAKQIAPKSGQSERTDETNASSAAANAGTTKYFI